MFWFFYIYKVDLYINILFSLGRKCGKFRTKWLLNLSSTIKIHPFSYCTYTSPYFKIWIALKKYWSRIWDSSVVYILGCRHETTSLIPSTIHMLSVISVTLPFESEYHNKKWDNCKQVLKHCNQVSVSPNHCSSIQGMEGG